MTAAEIQTEIDNVDTAIRDAIFGQSYSMDTGQGNIRVSRQSLGQLRQYRAELERRLSRLESGGYPTSAEVRHHTTR
jgi:hypothetical protein